MPKLATTKFTRVETTQQIKIGTSNLPELAKIGSFPSVETFDAPLLEALRYHKVSKSGVAEKDNAMCRQLIFCHIWILAVVKFGNKMILSESFIYFLRTSCQDVAKFGTS